MTLHNYVGITGFMKRSEVEMCLNAIPQTPNRKLMVGVLASWKSINNIPMQAHWQGRTPPLQEVANIFLNDKRLLNLIHLSLGQENKDKLLDVMSLIQRSCGPNFHGFQLNIPWPKIEILKIYRQQYNPKHRIVLQLSSQAITQTDSSPSKLADRLSEYAGLIDDILFDLSGGLGKTIDPEHALRYLLEITDRERVPGLGVAGGLGPDSLHFLKPIMIKLRERGFYSLNIDAENQLRDEHNNLDLKKATLYLQRSFTIR